MAQRKRVTRKKVQKTTVKKTAKKSVKKTAKKTAKKSVKKTSTTGTAQHQLEDGPSIFALFGHLPGEAGHVYEVAGYAQRLHRVGEHLVLLSVLKGEPYDDDATWAITSLSLEGGELGERHQLVLENTCIQRCFVLGDQLFVSHSDETKAVSIERYRLDRLGELTLVDRRAASGDEAVFARTFDYRVCFSDGRAFAPSDLGDFTHLVVHDVSDEDGSFSERARCPVVFGEPAKFLEHRGFASIDVRGSRAILAGPDSRRGYQLLDLSDLDAIRVLAAGAGKQNQQNIVRFVADDLFVAFGNFGKCLVFEHDAAKGKLKPLGTLNIKGTFSRHYQSGDELLFYAGRVGNSTESGFVVRVGGDDKPALVGELEFPLPVRQIVDTGERIVLCSDQHLHSYARTVKSAAPVKPKKKRGAAHWAAPDVSASFKNK